MACRLAGQTAASACKVWVGEREGERPRPRPFLYNKRNVTGLETGHKTQSAVELTSSYKKHEGEGRKVRRERERDWSAAADGRMDEGGSRYT